MFQLMMLLGEFFSFEIGRGEVGGFTRRVQMA